MDNRIKDSEFSETVIQIKRVSKKTKGGNKISFSALMVIGDKKGKVGIGFAKAPTVVAAIRKASRLAKDRLFEVPLVNQTIPHEVLVKFGASRVFLKPASPGTGLIAGGPVRVIVEAAGIQNIVAKIMGSKNKAGNIYATMMALKQLRRNPPASRLRQNKVRPSSRRDVGTTVGQGDKNETKSAF
ncbi:30S ribosomal protein S5 [Patescibacteria group bacterium]|nr:30S ribosomal protein S5 [Patescibacteria group bacterium]MBU1931295.1 30S ribosomal protein S5 [Patescibacteria group bacterium]